MFSSKSSFYITLPSNVKTKASHQKNLTSEYTTYLPRALELSADEWECALVEISYPHSFNNIHPPFDTVKFSWWDTNTKTQYNKVTNIPNSHYSSIDEVLEAINQLKPPGFKGNLDFTKKKRKSVKIVLHDSEELKIHHILAKLLGFDRTFFSFSDTSGIKEENIERTDDRIRIKADFHADIRALHYNFYVYSNIVQPHLCGSDYLPLLRTVNITGEEGDYISKIYEIPHYLPLTSNFIEFIEIKIADDLGNNIQFQYGKVIIKLHFRIRSFLHR